MIHRLDDHISDENRKSVAKGGEARDQIDVIRDVFHQMDSVDGDGEISFKEFEKGMQRVLGLEVTKVVTLDEHGHAEEEHNGDADGAGGPDENHWTTRDLKRVFRAIDRDQSHNISLEEVSLKGVFALNSY